MMQCRRVSVRKKTDFEPGFDDKGSLDALDHCPKDKKEDHQNCSVLYGVL